MRWELTEDVEAFAATAGDFLRSKPVEHTVLLTLVGNLRRRGLRAYGSEAPIFGWWREDSGPVTGVLLQTPPHPVLFSSLPADAVPAAVPALSGRSVPGVNMIVEQAASFVPLWERSTGTTSATRLRVRLYLLGDLDKSDLSPGEARVATSADRPLLLRWHKEFHEAIDDGPHGDAGADVDERLSYGGITLWEVDGEPVSMAARSRLEAGMVRVQMVYTPAALRGRGYAGAVTTTVSRQALDLGATSVVLFTDLANPTSNALYQRLGYRPVEDRVVMEFAT
ncbi:GNAT family N-acetyltransferase [Actinoplanes sp. CA-030573]|uniref:GNAT family N-acetyltransferase n=1 Tax=Actinoplanes sp. CA-030573 TaxID=3239898 RepID=UPI003D8CE8FE